MTNIWLSAHDDDSALFGAFTISREKPLVIVCTDSYVQSERGEVGCSAEDRAKETEEEMKILGVDHIRLGLNDSTVEMVDIRNKLISLNLDPDVVYAPMVQMGNAHHDMVSRVADELWPGKVFHYPTYTKTELYTRGTIEVVPTYEETLIKASAMSCHESQRRINRPHFDAVRGKSEWLIGKRKLHIGCGRNLRKGWVNLDKMPYADVQADVTEGIPFEDNYFDEVFSEDFLEHTPTEKKVFIMNEIWRVLKPGGVMEHFIPNAGSRNDFGSPSHLSHWNLQQFEHFDVDSYRYEKDREYEGFIGGFKKVYAGLLSWDAIDQKHQALNVKYQAVK